MRLDCFTGSQLASEMTGVLDCLMMSVSYESRSELIRSKLSESKINVIAFYHGNHDYIRPYVEKARRQVPNSTFVSISSDLPLQTFDAMRRVVTEEFGGSATVKVGVDITCFTREALAMLLLVLRRLLPTGSTVICLYSAAANYSKQKIGDSGDCWLSRGIAEVRTILGYRGSVRLSGKTHLILLPGFETERAQSIVEFLEPDRLSIGHLDEDQSVNPQFVDRAEQMAQRLATLFLRTPIARLEFSAKDPYLTRDRILASTDISENTVVSCLNTKVSMAGACMAAFAEPSIQLIYAQPVTYNTSECAEPADQFIRFTLD